MCVCMCVYVFVCVCMCVYVHTCVCACNVCTEGPIIWGTTFSCIYLCTEYIYLNSSSLIKESLQNEAKHHAWKRSLQRLQQIT